MTLAVFIPTLLTYQSIFQLKENGNWISYPNILTEDYSIALQVAIFSPLDMVVTVGPLLTAHFQFEALVGNWLDIAAIKSKAKLKAKSSSKRTTGSSSRLESFGSLRSGSKKMSSFATSLKKLNYRNLVNQKFQIGATVLSLAYGIVVLFVSIIAYTNVNEARCQSMLASDEYCQQTISSWDIVSDRCNCFSFSLPCKGLTQPGNVKLPSEEVVIEEVVSHLLENDLNPNTLHYLELGGCGLNDPPQSLSNYKNIIVLRLLLNNFEEDAEFFFDEMTNLVSFTYFDRNPVERLPDFFKSLPPHLAAIETNLNVGVMPPWIEDSWKNLYRLEILDAQFDHIEWLPLLPELHYFSCEGCGLKDIPEAISQNKQLVGLFLSNNEITTVPHQALGSMDNLIILALADNNISQLGWSASDLEWLKMDANNTEWNVPGNQPNPDIPAFSMLALWDNPICDDPEYSSLDVCASPCVGGATCNYFTLHDIACIAKCRSCGCKNPFAQKILEAVNKVRGGKGGGGKGGGK